MSFSDEDVQKVWNKGKVVSDKDPSMYRKDDCGAVIKRTEYGDRNSEHGWEIDHISPGDNDNPSNLRPLQWKNNVDKSDGRLKCNCTSKDQTS